MGSTLRVITEVKTGRFKLNEFWRDVKESLDPRGFPGEPKDLFLASISREKP
jgi:hypothetical protein